MKKVPILLLAILAFPTFAFAAQVFGSLKEGDRSVGEGVEIQIQCRDKPYPVRTDSYGSYSVYLEQPGKCTFTVNYRGQSSQPFEIYSYNDPVRYDFELVKQSDGVLVLKRR